KEERRRSIDAFRFATLRICSARLDIVYPEAKTRLVRLTVEEVQVLLADEVFGPVQRIQRISIRRSIEPGISVQPKLTEASLRRTEDKISPRRRDRVEAIRIDLVEMVIALSVRHCQTILRAAQAHSGAFDRITVGINDPA